MHCHTNNVSKNLCIFAGAVPPKIKIIGGLGDPAAGKKTEYRIENAYDGSNKHCYIPGTNKNAQSRFEIANSLVSYVRVLNRQDCCG